MSLRARALHRARCDHAPASPARWHDERPGPIHSSRGRASAAAAGGRARAERAIGSRVMRDAMPEQHRELFERLPFVLHRQRRTRTAGRRRRRSRARRASCTRPTRARWRSPRCPRPERPAGALRCARARRSGCSASSRTRAGAIALNGMVGDVRRVGVHVAGAAELRQLPEVHPGAARAFRESEARGDRAPASAAAARRRARPRSIATADTFYIARPIQRNRVTTLRRTGSMSRIAAASPASCASIAAARSTR